ncbi:MAG: D-2-hydroxyacid dehydrogenase family protein [Rhodospirillales bacterium]
MKLAILDDYQSLATTIVDWSQVDGLDVAAFSDHVFDEAALITRLSDFDAVLRIRERTEFPRSTLEALPRLKLLLATGMRNARSIDLAAADELGITVSTTHALHRTTVEVTWLLILSLFRQFPGEIGSVRHGGWQRGLGRGLDGKTLGVLGFGDMGQPVSKIAQNFGMHVIAWSPHLTPERTASHNVECVSKDELFKRADAVTIHIPDSDTTRGLVGAHELSLMKSDAFLINTSRPAIVDQDAFLKALETQSIGGAGLDVFDIEPLPQDHPYRILPNVISTPHIGFVTEENYRIFYEESLENLKSYMAGKPIRTISADQPFRPESRIGSEQKL